MKYNYSYLYIIIIVAYILKLKITGHKIFQTIKRDMNYRFFISEKAII